MRYTNRHFTYLLTYKRILLASPLADWRRQLGRPRITWLSTVQQDLKQHHVMLSEAADLAQNRPLWSLMSTYGATQLWVACQKRRRHLYGCCSPVSSHSERGNVRVPWTNQGPQNREVASDCFLVPAHSLTLVPAPDVDVDVWHGVCDWQLRGPAMDWSVLLLTFSLDVPIW